MPFYNIMRDFLGKKMESGLGSVTIQKQSHSELALQGARRTIPPKAVSLLSRRTSFGAENRSTLPTKSAGIIQGNNFFW